jgi:hypothetical protein
MSVGYRHSNVSASKKDLVSMVEKLQIRFESRIDKLEKHIVTVQSHTEALLSEFFKLNAKNSEKVVLFPQSREAYASSELDACIDCVVRDSGSQRIEGYCATSNGIVSDRSGAFCNINSSAENIAVLSHGVSSDLVFAHYPSALSVGESADQEKGVAAIKEDDGIVEGATIDPATVKIKTGKPPPRDLRIASGRELLRGGEGSDGSSSSSEDNNSEGEEESKEQGWKAKPLKTQARGQ